MRIGIEAQRLFRPHKHGMDRVALELIRNLQLMDKENQYFIFVRPDEDNSIISETDNFKIVEIPGGPYPLWEQYKLPMMAKRLGCDVLHCTSNTAPIFLNSPLLTTVHDIIYMEGSVFNLLGSSASAYQKFGNLYRRLIMKSVVNRSKSVITVSNFEKENIANYYSNQKINLNTIHNGVSEQFRTIPEPHHIKSVMEKYKLPENYFLCFASKDPRKNTKGILKAYQDYCRLHGADSKLVVIGYNQEDLQSDLNELGAVDISGQIILTGYVSDGDLPVLYKQATAFLFPSFREGFGIPVIEAMACGTPVITSNTSSMPEVAGKAALLVNPEETKEITSGMHKVVTDIELKRRLITRGLEQSAQFSWKRMAGEVLELYKSFNPKYKTLLS